MPNCAVLTCLLRSENVNIVNDGISFFRFPQNPEMQEKWIAATGRKDWVPKKRSAVCSKHFGEDDFLATPSHRILNSSAVPHIDISRSIPECEEIDRSEPGVSTKMVKAEPDEEVIEITPDIRNDIPSSKAMETPRERKLQRIVNMMKIASERRLKLVKRMRSQNKRLMAKNETLKAKNETLTKLLQEAMELTANYANYEP